MWSRVHDYPCEPVQLWIKHVKSHCLSRILLIDHLSSAIVLSEESRFWIGRFRWPGRPPSQPAGASDSEGLALSCAVDPNWSHTGALLGSKQSGKVALSFSSGQRKILEIWRGSAWYRMTLIGLYLRLMPWCKSCLAGKWMEILGKNKTQGPKRMGFTQTEDDRSFKSLLTQSKVLFYGLTSPIMVYETVEEWYKQLAELVLILEMCKTWWFG